MHKLFMDVEKSGAKIALGSGKRDRALSNQIHDTISGSN
jgi:hypothetical protein